ncbi:MAG: hypothetical protein V7K88_19250 [Nostoc sp.]
MIDFPDVLAYGQTREEAVARVQALALRVSGETNHKDTESAEKQE